MPQNPQNTTIQTALKHYNQFRRVVTEALRWLKTTKDTRKIIKVETETKERYQKLLDLIKIEIIEVEGQKSPDNGILICP